jgi:hypothetical protein
MFIRLTELILHIGNDMQCGDEHTGDIGVGLTERFSLLEILFVQGTQGFEGLLDERTGLG